MRNFPLFTIAGFRVKANPSWLLLAALIVWSLGGGFFPMRYPGLSGSTYWAMAVLGTALLFFSLLFHEFSHSLLARRRGMKIGGITLFLFGGVAELTEEPPSPRIEAEVAAAGPLSSLLLAALFHLLALGLAAIGFPQHWNGVFAYAATINIVLALFNLVPGFPLDGGRLLRAFLWHRSGDMLAATRTASRIGKFFAYLLIGLGILSFLTTGALGGMWWVLIGFFLMSAASAAYEQLAARMAFEGVPIRRFIAGEPVAVEAGLPLDRFVEDYAYRHHYSLYPVIDHGRPVGAIRTRDVRTIPREDWPRSHVSDLLRPLSPEITLPADRDAARALEQMQQSGSPQLLVLDGDRLIGVVTLGDLLRALAIRRDIDATD
ncbi:MAG: site-2 protease family protein [Rhodothalassiaceae bacterium]